MHRICFYLFQKENRKKYKVENFEILNVFYLILEFTLTIYNAKT